MRALRFMAPVLAAATALPAPFALAAEPKPLVFWGLQAEQLEVRVGEEDEILAWDFDAFVGTDDLKFVWRSEAEYLVDDGGFEVLENQARLQKPISTFFDVVGGIRVDTPEGEDRVYGVIGLHGLAPQWFEIDADAFVSENGDPSLRFEAEYEGLLTNRITLVPSLEIDLPLTDDEEIGLGGGAPTIEVGARLSYDLLDRAVSPYIGVHYEQAFGETANLMEAEGEDAGQVFGVVGVRLIF